MELATDLQGSRLMRNRLTSASGWSCRPIASGRVVLPSITLLLVNE